MTLFLSLERIASLPFEEGRLVITYMHGGPEIIDLEKYRLYRLTYLGHLAQIEALLIDLRVEEDCDVPVLEDLAFHIRKCI